MILEIQRFILAAQEGSITRAAEKSFITQSALTQSIKRLEKELNIKLFTQIGKQLQLTDDGKAMVIIGNKMLVLWKHAKAIDAENHHVKKYSIGMYDNAALRLSPFLKGAIQSNIELIIDSSTKLFSQLKLGTLDAAVCVISKKDQLPKNIKLIAVFSEKLIPVSSANFTGKINTLPFILYNQGSHTRKQTDAIFRMKNIHPKIFAESTSTTFMKELALLGSGIALLPQNFVQSELAQKKLMKLRLPLSWERTFGLFINEESGLTADDPLIKNLIKQLQKTK